MKTNLYSFPRSGSTLLRYLIIKFLKVKALAISAIDPVAWEKSGKEIEPTIMPGGRPFFGKIEDGLFEMDNTLPDIEVHRIHYMPPLNDEKCIFIYRDIVDVIGSIACRSNLNTGAHSAADGLLIKTCELVGPYMEEGNAGYLNFVKMAHKKLKKYPNSIFVIHYEDMQNPNSIRETLINLSEYLGVAFDESISDGDIQMGYDMSKRVYGDAMTLHGSEKKTFYKEVEKYAEEYLKGRDDFEVIRRCVEDLVSNATGNRATI
jgi:hypothetical protein